MPSAVAFGAALSVGAVRARVRRARDISDGSENRPLIQKPEIIKAELVLLAMGFLKPEHPEYPQNVFVCGDSANGASLVVRAMASGKQTAQKVAAFLSK